MSPAAQLAHRNPGPRRRPVLDRHPAPEGSPAYVCACAGDRWRLAMWPRAGGRGLAVPYRCGSRRHPGECKDKWCRRWYARLTAGELANADPRHVLFATWTLDASWHRPQWDAPAAREWWSSDDWRKWNRQVLEGTAALTAAVGEHLRRLSNVLARRGRGKRRVGRRDGRPLRYAWVVEWHASGVAHVHAVLVSPWLAAELELERSAAQERDDEAGEPCATFLAALEGVANIGRVDLSRARSVEGVRKYVAKVAASLGGELAKSQGHLGARSHQRTFGASKGMLAPHVKRETEWTGTLLRRDGSPVRFDPLTWQAEGLAVQVARGDIRGVAFMPGDPVSAMDILKVAPLVLDSMPLRIVPPTMPVDRRRLAPIGARQLAYDFAPPPRRRADHSPGVAPRGP